MWSGVWPGVVECREFGWWSLWVDGSGWQRVPAGTPDAAEDLSRLYQGEAKWDRLWGRWVLP